MINTNRELLQLHEDYLAARRRRPLWYLANVSRIEELYARYTLTINNFFKKLERLQAEYFVVTESPETGKKILAMEDELDDKGQPIKLPDGTNKQRLILLPGKTEEDYLKAQEEYFNEPTASFIVMPNKKLFKA